MSDIESGYKPPIKDTQFDQFMSKGDEIKAVRDAQDAAEAKKAAQKAYMALLESIQKNIGSTGSRELEQADGAIRNLLHELEAVEGRDERIAPLRRRLFNEFAQSNAVHDRLLQSGSAYEQEFERANEAIRQTLEELKAVYSDDRLNFSDRPKFKSI